jgi:hypothetical protein
MDNFDLEKCKEIEKIILSEALKSKTTASFKKNEKVIQTLNNDKKILSFLAKRIIVKIMFLACQPHDNKDIFKTENPQLARQLPGLFSKQADIPLDTVNKLYEIVDGYLS